jgi:two-component sensor histidine kinase
VTGRQFALDNMTPAAPTPLILRSTIIPAHARGPSPPRRAFEELLLEHCERILASARPQKLVVQLELRLEGICPSTHEETVLRVTDELLSNAMEHGYYSRQCGQVFVYVFCRAGVGVQISVSDDGWGFDSGPIVDGNGFHLLRMIGDLDVETAKTAPFVAKTTVTVIMPLHRRVPVTFIPARGRGYEVK